MWNLMHHSSGSVVNSFAAVASCAAVNNVSDLNYKNNRWHGMTRRRTIKRGCRVSENTLTTAQIARPRSGCLSDRVGSSCLSDRVVSLFDIGNILISFWFACISWYFLVSFLCYYYCCIVGICWFLYFCVFIWAMCQSKLTLSYQTTTDQNFPWRCLGGWLKVYLLKHELTLIWKSSLLPRGICIFVEIINLSKFTDIPTEIPREVLTRGG